MGFGIGPEPEAGAGAKLAVGIGCCLGHAIDSNSFSGCYAFDDAISSLI